MEPERLERVAHDGAGGFGRDPGALCGSVDGIAERRAVRYPARDRPQIHARAYLAALTREGDETETRAGTRVELARRDGGHVEREREELGLARRLPRFEMRSIARDVGEIRGRVIDRQRLDDEPVGDDRRHRARWPRTASSVRDASSRPSR